MEERNYKIIVWEEMSNEFEKRYVVIDAETSDIVDNAHGYGYKSLENADRSWCYKNNLVTLYPKKKKRTQNNDDDSSFDSMTKLRKRKNIKEEIRWVDDEIYNDETYYDSLLDYYDEHRSVRDRY